MFVGHAAVALAVVGLGAFVLGWPRERALALGAFAAAVATLPDIDMLYALTGLLSAGSLDAFVLAEGFWRASTAVHRSVTHSIVLAVPVALAIGLVAAGGRRRLAGIGAAIALVGLLVVGSQPVVWLVVASFLAGAVAMGVLARRLDLRPLPATLAAAVALLSHPFGDLFTGEPPWLLYPFEMQVVAERVALAGDPTIHLLGAFFIELAAIWLGVLAVAELRDASVRAHIRPRAVLGGAYAMAALVLPAPTLSVSYHFVFSVTAVGFVGAIQRPKRSTWPTRLVTGLAAITVAGVAYAGAYLVMAV